MAGQYTGLQKSYRIDAGNLDSATGKNEIPRYRGVIQSGDGICMLPINVNEVPLGVIANDERLDDPKRDGGSQAGRQIAVQLGGIANIELSGVVAASDRVILDVDGKVKKLPDPTVDLTIYNVLGFAEKAGKKGDVIPVRMSYHTVSVVKPFSGENDILTFELAVQTGPAVINKLNSTVAIEVANGTDVTDLTPTITLSEGATYIPKGSVDFTNPVSYIVEAENGLVQVWTVTVTEAQ